MAQKQGSSQKKRTTKQSAGTARGSKPVHLSELQKVLLVNGGIGHRLRKSGPTSNFSKRAVRSGE